MSVYFFCLQAYGGILRTGSMQLNSPYKLNTLNMLMLRVFFFSIPKTCGEGNLGKNGRSDC